MAPIGMLYIMSNCGPLAAGGRKYVLSVSGMIAGAKAGVYVAVWSIQEKNWRLKSVCGATAVKRVAATHESLRTDTSYPDGLYRLTVVGALHAFRSHSLPRFKYIADPRTLLFSGS